MRSLVKVLLLGATVGVMIPAVDAKAGGNCDRPKFCPQVWAPVICDDGKVYPNDCYAQKKCATGCVPYDEWLLVANNDKKKPGGGGCPRTGWLCPDVYDPVICDDGNVYSNSCYAWVACATGCEPYGDGGPIELKKSCPWEDLQCPDVWDPVECGGKEYSNACYALADCCFVGGGFMVGDGDVITSRRGDHDAVEKKSCIWDDLQCPDIWDPVECGGQEYPNACYALADCCFVGGGGGLANGDQDGVITSTRGQREKRFKLCPWWDLQCLDVWDPVECDGVVYSNACYALRACAENCSGGGTAAAAEPVDEITTTRGDDEKFLIWCPYWNIYCLDIWDPVTCDGVVYSNSCYALRACAENCTEGITQ